MPLVYKRFQSQMLFYFVIATRQYARAERDVKRKGVVGTGRADVSLVATPARGGRSSRCSRRSCLDGEGASGYAWRDGALRSPEGPGFRLDFDEARATGLLETRA